MPRIGWGKRRSLRAASVRGAGDSPKRGLVAAGGTAMLNAFFASFPLLPFLPSMPLPCIHPRARATCMLSWAWPEPPLERCESPRETAPHAAERWRRLPAGAARSAAPLDSFLSCGPV